MAPRKKKTEDKVVPKKREFVLNIFDVLKAADRGDFDYYSKLTEEQQKAVHPLVLMRWMSVVSNSSGFSETCIIAMNNFVNIGFWDLSDHPELQWKLLAASGTRMSTTYSWIAGSKRLTTTKLDRLLLQFNSGLNEMELDLVKRKLNRDSLKQLCRDYAMEDSEIRPILEEFKKYTDAQERE